MEAFVGTSGWYYSWNEGGSLDWYLEHTHLNAVELNASSNTNIETKIIQITFPLPPPGSFMSRDLPTSGHGLTLVHPGKLDLPAHGVSGVEGREVLPPDRAAA